MHFLHILQKTAKPTVGVDLALAFTLRLALDH